MFKITWINFLHFYQSPTADNEVVALAVEKSYKRIIGSLKRNPSVKFTINITGCLLDKLFRLGYTDLIDDIKRLNQAGRIELVGSAAFHPILPLLPKKEIIRNIEINEQILKRYFGDDLKLRGFFPPEAAISAPVMKIIKDLGYEWLLADQISSGGGLGELDLSKKFIDKSSGLEFCFRQRSLSQSYIPKTIFDLINRGRETTVITATDAELYGLRHGDFSATFEKLLKRPELTTLTVSQYLGNLKAVKKISPLAASWETTARELKQGEPFSLWRDQKNKIQILLWRLANLAIVQVDKFQSDENYGWSRMHLDKGLASCTFWWASARDFKLFGGASWNPDEVEKGLNELVRSVRALAAPETRRVKIEAEKLYIKIKTMIWRKHWEYYWKKT